MGGGGEKGSFTVGKKEREQLPGGKAKVGGEEEKKERKRKFLPEGGGGKREFDRPGD